MAQPVLGVLLLGIFAGPVVAEKMTSYDQPWGTCTYDMRQVVGSPCWDPRVPAAPDAQVALDEAARIAEVSAGLACWDPSTGRVGTHLVVRDAETRAITLIPFDAAAVDAASAGAFWTLRACSAA